MVRHIWLIMKNTVYIFITFLCLIFKQVYFNVLKYRYMLALFVFGTVIELNMTDSRNFTELSPSLILLKQFLNSIP